MSTDSGVGSGLRVLGPISLGGLGIGTALATIGAIILYSVLLGELGQDLEGRDQAMVVLLYVILGIGTIQGGTLVWAAVRFPRGALTAPLTTFAVLEGIAKLVGGILLLVPEDPLTTEGVLLLVMGAVTGAGILSYFAPGSVAVLSGVAVLTLAILQIVFSAVVEDSTTSGTFLAGPITGDEVVGAKVWLGVAALFLLGVGLVLRPVLQGPPRRAAVGVFIALAAGAFAGGLLWTDIEAISDINWDALDQLPDDVVFPFWVTITGLFVHLAGAGFAIPASLLGLVFATMPPVGPPATAPTPVMAGVTVPASASVVVPNWVCPRCGRAVMAGATRCVQCGASLRETPAFATCRTCRAPLESLARRCRTCGTLV